MKIPLLIVSSILCFLNPAHAWNTIGHRMVAETAALLINTHYQSGWGPFLSGHRFELGVYSMFPDSQYRGMDGRKGRQEGPTHYFYMDVLHGILGQDAPKLLPENQKSFTQFLSQTHNISFKKIQELGVSPWRVHQFLGLAWNALKNVRTLKGEYIQANSILLKKNEIRSLYEGLYFLGVLSHYSADATMPYHATQDYNGWATDQGGIHFYIENECGMFFEPGLSEAVFKHAKNQFHSWQSEWKNLSPVRLMYSIFSQSLKQIPKLAKIDKEDAVLTLSNKKQNLFAKRKPAHEGCQKFKDPLIESLALASVLTAELWSRVLPSSIDAGEDQLIYLGKIQFNHPYIEPHFDRLLALPESGTLSKLQTPAR